MAYVGKHRMRLPEPEGVSRRGALLATAATAGTLAAPTVAGASAAQAITNGLYEKIYNIDASTTGALAVSVHDLRSQGRWNYNAPLRNECASIVKVLILATVCYRAQMANRALSAWEKQQASIMIRFSDNTATTNLWKSIGGAPTVQAMANRLAMSQTVTSTAWGLTRTSAYDQTLLMDEIAWNGVLLSATNRTYMLGLMGTVTTGQRWGVGSYGVSQVKNGWLPYNGQWRINSIGRVSGGGRNYTMAILQRTPTMAIGTSVATKVALTLYNHLVTPL